jgi:uncharacterized protein (TIGR03437 family)
MYRRIGLVTYALAMVVRTGAAQSVPVPTISARTVNGVSSGIVDGAAYLGTPSGGSIASLFGTGLAVSAVTATTLPLPTTLGGTTVTIGGIAVPLFAVSPAQINFQFPYEICCTEQMPVTVTVNGVSSNTVLVAAGAYGTFFTMFSADSSGSGQGAIQIADTSILAAPAGSIPGALSRPVGRGESLSIYCLGLGPVTNAPAAGNPAPADPLARSLTPTVWIGGILAPVTFAGLAPGTVGVYQVNVQVPAGAPSGEAVPVVMNSSNTVTIAVQ